MNDNFFSIPEHPDYTGPTDDILEEFLSSKKPLNDESN